MAIIIHDIVTGETKGLKKSQQKVELEVVLTQSSFGFEYARLNLQEAGSVFQQQALLWELESYQKAYLDAREELSVIDPDRLLAVEDEIKLQKQNIFEALCTLQ